MQLGHLYTYTCTVTSRMSAEDMRIGIVVIVIVITVIVVTAVIAVIVDEDDKKQAS